MLFARIYKFKGTTEEGQKRSTQLYTQRSSTGKVPYKIKAHYEHCTGGIVIVETDSAEALIEGTIPWLPYFDFEVIPIVEVEASVRALQRVYRWRDSVS